MNLNKNLSDLNWILKRASCNQMLRKNSINRGENVNQNASWWNRIQIRHATEESDGTPDIKFKLTFVNNGTQSPTVHAHIMNNNSEWSTKGYRYCLLSSSISADESGFIRIVFLIVVVTSDWTIVVPWVPAETGIVWWLGWLVCYPFGYPGFNAFNCYWFMSSGS